MSDTHKDRDVNSGGSRMINPHDGKVRSSTQLHKSVKDYKRENIKLDKVLVLDKNRNIGKDEEFAVNFLHWLLNKNSPYDVFMENGGHVATDGRRNYTVEELIDIFKAKKSE